MLYTPPLPLVQVRACKKNSPARARTSGYGYGTGKKRNVIPVSGECVALPQYRNPGNTPVKRYGDSDTAIVRFLLASEF